MVKQSEGNYCTVKDDMQERFPKAVEVDALMVASPVYLCRLSGHLASSLDRLRRFIHANHYGGSVKHKVGAALAVGWLRNSGIETAINSIHWAVLAYQMVIATPGTMSRFGGGSVSSLGGTGGFIPTISTRF